MNPMLLQTFYCLFGFALLYFGAGWLVRGASGLARRWGISPIVVGLTVVAFGTSAPELVVSVLASLKGQSLIAVGNVVGSNICNIALVLGISALFFPIRGSRSVVRRDIPIMLAVSGVLFLLSYNDVISRMEGAVLLVGIVAYTLFNYGRAKAEGAAAVGIDLAEVREADAKRDSMLLLAVFVVAGIAGVVWGADLVVGAAEAIMRRFGISEKFIGLTMVAFGTSLPELATSVVAAARKEPDISIGNLVGSNVFNILSVLGAAAVVTPIHIAGGFWDGGLWIDYLVMLGTSCLPLLLMRGDNMVSRRGGAVLLGCYVAYLAWLVSTL